MAFCMIKVLQKTIKSSASYLFLVLICGGEDCADSGNEGSLEDGRND